MRLKLTINENQLRSKDDKHVMSNSFRVALRYWDFHYDIIGDHIVSVTMETFRIVSNPNILGYVPGYTAYEGKVPVTVIGGNHKSVFDMVV